MSGGHFNYSDGMLRSEIFVSWGDRRAVNDDPFGDIEISDLVWDVFDLIHALDYWKSGDFGEGSYREEITTFKDKWFGKGAHQKRLLKYIDEKFAQTRAECVALATGKPITED